MRELNSNLGLNKDDGNDIITEGVVISTSEYYSNGTIRVTVNNKNEIDCRPLLPIYLMVIPKVTDSVNLILKKSNTKTEYLWVGPIITDYKKLNSTSRVGDKVYVHGKSITKYPNAKGIYPSLEDITFNGRWNSDIRLGKNQTLIRAGFHNIDNNEEYNLTNQSYSLLRLSPTKDGKKTRGTHNIVGEYINLISHDGTPKFNVSDRNEVITEEMLNKILDEAHPAVFGDNLADFLRLIVKFCATHQHNFHNLPPVQLENEVKIAKFDLNSINSKKIKLN